MGAIWKAWGANIDAELRRLGKSQAWLADAAGVDRASVSRWVNGVTGPKDELKIVVARVLGVSAHTLFPLEERGR